MSTSVCMIIDFDWNHAMRLVEKIRLNCCGRKNKTKWIVGMEQINSNCWIRTLWVVSMHTFSPLLQLVIPFQCSWALWHKTCLKSRPYMLHLLGMFVLHKDTIMLICLLFYTTLYLPHVSIIRKTNQVRRKLSMSPFQNHPYHNPETFNIFPKESTDIQSHAGKSEHQIWDENDLVVVIFRRGEKLLDKGHSSLFLKQNWAWARRSLGAQWTRPSKQPILPLPFGCLIWVP